MPSGPASRSATCEIRNPHRNLWLKCFVFRIFAANIFDGNTPSSVVRVKIISNFVAANVRKD